MGGGNPLPVVCPGSGYGLSPRGRGKQDGLPQRVCRGRSIPAWAGETSSILIADEEGAVYPRVGGGNEVVVGPGANLHGLSPRGRGKPSGGGGWLVAGRSIPAWAGETYRCLRLLHPAKVYPRVGGGNRRRCYGWRQADGLSPRGRGKRERPQWFNPFLRSIPAWAGETQPGKEIVAELGVYPRVGGGNRGRSSGCIAAFGLSPRGRGKPPEVRLGLERGRSIPAWAGETDARVSGPAPGRVYPRVGGGNAAGGRRAWSTGGLSPRGRGKPTGLSIASVCRRSIPAWAGETPSPGRRTPGNRVYPRVGGGNVVGSGLKDPRNGLSPRGRGKRLALLQYPTLRWSIPAWAGETVVRICSSRALRVYPRVGGGNARGEKKARCSRGLSPRGRGKRRIRIRRRGRRRSIPAWAGETCGCRTLWGAGRVYPRVGGGNQCRSRIPRRAKGLSPRGRGKPMSLLTTGPAGRSIPAWAGETHIGPPAGTSPPVYPRVGGGNPSMSIWAKEKVGLSPRGRGKRVGIQVKTAYWRSIPAWAGETAVHR